MPDLLEDRLRALLAEPDSEPVRLQVKRRARHRRVGRRLFAGAVALGLAASGLTLTALGGGDATDVQVGPSADDGFPPGWTSLGDTGLEPRVEPAVAATSDGMFVWGGASAKEGPDGLLPGDLLTDGVTYDIATQTWTPLPPGPGDGYSKAFTIWTGEQVLLLAADGPATATDVWAWNPSSGQWSVETQLPAPSCTSSQELWTGHRLYVSCIQGTSNVVVHAYDPAAGTWEEVGAVGLPGDTWSLTWTGTSLLAIGLLEGDPLNVVTANVPPGTGWELRSSPAIPLAWHLTATNRRSLLALDHAAAVRYDVAADTWTTLSPPPADSDGSCVQLPRSVGGQYLAQSCAGVSVLDHDDVWRPELLDGATLVGSAAGARVLYAVAEDGEAWAFNPEPEPTAPDGTAEDTLTSAPPVTASTLPTSPDATAPQRQPLELGGASILLPEGMSSVGWGDFNGVEGQRWVYTVSDGERTCELSSGSSAGGAELPGVIDEERMITVRNGALGPAFVGRMTDEGDPELGTATDLFGPPPFLVRWEWPGGDDGVLQAACADEALAIELAEASAPSSEPRTEPLDER